MTKGTISALAGALLLAGLAPATAQEHPMGFFVTSTGVGDGANLGGLEGADAHCDTLATAAGSDCRRISGSRMVRLSQHAS